MTTLKVDNVIFESIAGDVSVALSDTISPATYALITGIINPTNGDITTTGTISGASYKSSGNVTVIDSFGGVSPYGLYLLPSGVGISGYIAIKKNPNITEWTFPVTSSFAIALGKC
jgi:hypothetical protein